MLRFETSLSPPECMMRILSVADVDSPTAPIGGKRFLCVMNGDRFCLRFDKRRKRRSQCFHGRLQPSASGTTIEGRFLGLPPWGVHIAMCGFMILTFLTMGFFPGLTGLLAERKLSPIPWIDLLVLASLIVFGRFLASVTCAYVREQQETIVRVLEELFGKPVIQR